MTTGESAGPVSRGLFERRPIDARAIRSLVYGPGEIATLRARLHDALGGGARADQLIE